MVGDRKPLLELNCLDQKPSARPDAPVGKPSPFQVRKIVRISNATEEYA
jgi:hypothetical protein